MAVILVMYHHPTDPKAFDDYYYGTHVDIAKKIPGLTRYGLSASPVTSIDGSPGPFHLIAHLEFATLEDLQTAMGTPEVAAAAGDLTNFATGGATIYMYDTKEA